VNGYACVDGTAPGAIHLGLVCSLPEAASAGTRGYCCIQFPMTTLCVPYPAASCPANPNGFACMGSDTPEEATPVLSCGAPSADPTLGGNDFCCTFVGGD
jgi:hypothetical protein